MALSLISSAQLTPDGKHVTVSGPLTFAPAQTGADVLMLHFVVVHGTDFAHGDAATDGGRSTWVETVPVFGAFGVGDVVQGFGVALLLGPEDPATRTRTPQTLTWADQVTIAAPLTAATGA